MSSSGAVVKGRDARWEKVWARIGPPEISGSDLETGFYKTLEQQIEIRIEVPYKDTLLYAVHRVHKDEIKMAYGNIWTFTLDMMVEFIDREMEKRGG